MYVALVLCNVSVLVAVSIFAHLYARTAMLNTSSSGGDDFKKWRVVLASSLVAAIVTLVLLAMYGTGEEGMRQVIRATGRYSFPLFVMSSTASSLVKLRSNSTTRWLSANRRYIGLSFATTYIFHSVGFLALMLEIGNPGIDGLELILSMICYVFLAIMTLTSFDRFKQRMSKWVWDGLHSTGVLFLWYFFLQEFLHKMEDDSFWYYFPLVVMTAAILPIKFIAIAKPQTAKG